MNFRKLKGKIAARLPQRLVKPVWRSADEYAFKGPGSVREDIERKYGWSGDLLDIFVSNPDNIVHKWHHYLPLYDRYLSRFRAENRGDTPLRFLEIGVSKGGSLQIWRRYFGPDAIIFGIDINEDCRRFDGQAGQVRIGSQDDPKFLADVVAEMGGVDVVLDDGSHVMKHIRTSLDCLFPHVSEGGLYMIEDLHTAYWKMHGGGYWTPQNFFRFVGELMDDMHHWYHDEGMQHPQISNACPGIHIHDSIVVLEKAAVHAPASSRIA
ncbi:class I SAM-dependent methyltransferase [Sphingobium nicotianae]|uniref:Class I SAM-dependent methyltransferase n=1 Tax=Sphingobium nicotianae TaxID=2782607 RepID=A0A9X1DFF0_9SPHN|nr:class I SAM-dependent methyltransferase [Sphingobium nicotianae]MBT2189220.1 class I SAM-dependent methyltransferase [Sphingobium nicotianae]